MTVNVKAIHEQELLGFHSFVEEEMQKWQVPGLAIAIVKDGEVVLSEGFGYRDVENKLPITPNTQFVVASCTKAFCTMSIGLLVDEGKLDWDDPVHKYLPDFKLKDRFASEQITIRDIVTHRSGLPRHDLLWYNSSFTRKEVVERVQHVEPSKGFRTTFQYQNMMYMTAGEVVEAVTGEKWEDFVKEKVLKPLGMSESNFSVEKLQKAADFSYPYKEKDEKVEKIPFRKVDEIGPAGAMNSTVNELINWVQLHLNKGKLNGETFISEGNLKQMHTPQMILAEQPKYDELMMSTYGLGWFIQVYKGHKMIHHGGNLDGFSAMVSFMPDINVGIVILTNKNACPLRDFLAFNIYDRFLKMEVTDWSSRFKEDTEKLKNSMKEKKEKSEKDRKQGTNPSHPLEDYVGLFEHPGYGIFTVHLENEELRGEYNQIPSVLKHYHYDVFSLEFDEAFELDIKISFSSNPKGKINSLAIQLEPTVDELIFKRIQSKEGVPREFIEPFIGKYEVEKGPTIEVKLREEDQALLLSIPGQPQQELFHTDGTEFELKGLVGYSVEFVKNDDCDVISVTISQPQAVFHAIRK